MAVVKKVMLTADAIGQELTPKMGHISKARRAALAKVIVDADEGSLIIYGCVVQWVNVRTYDACNLQID